MSKRRSASRMKRISKRRKSGGVKRKNVKTRRMSGGMQMFTHVPFTEPNGDTGYYTGRGKETSDGISREDNEGVMEYDDKGAEYVGKFANNIRDGPGTYKKGNKQWTGNWKGLHSIGQVTLHQPGIAPRYTNKFIEKLTVDDELLRRSDESIGFNPSRNRSRAETVPSPSPAPAPTPAKVTVPLLPPPPRNRTSRLLTKNR